MKSYRFIPSMFSSSALARARLASTKVLKSLGPSGGQDSTETTDSTTETNTDVEEATDIAQDATPQEAPQCALENVDLNEFEAWRREVGWWGWRIHPPWCRR